jgi:hypothetical protein
MATVSDDLSRPVCDGPVGDSFWIEPSLGQYTDEMVLSFFVQTVKLITQHRWTLLLTPTFPGNSQTFFLLDPARTNS